MDPCPGCCRSWIRAGGRRGLLEAGLKKVAYELQFQFGGYGFGFVLQPIPGTDYDDADGFFIRAVNDPVFPDRNPVVGRA